MSWPTVALGDISRPRQWPTLAKAQMRGGDVPVYGANGIIGFTDTPSHTRATILIGCRGSCGTVHVFTPPAYANGNAMALDDLREDLVSLPFLAHFLRARGFADIVTGVAQPQIVQNKLVSIRIPLPPLSEQRRIAAILDAADALRAKRRAALAKLDTLAQSIFVEMFGDPITKDSAWPVLRLEDIIPEDRPLTYGILMPGEDQADGIPYVRVVDMKGGGIDVVGVRRTTREISNQYRRSLLKGGDLLISIRGHVGRTAIVPEELENANITQDTARIASSRFDLRFVQELLRHRSTQHWMARRTKGAAVRGINLGDLRHLPLISPPRRRQEKFGDAASAMHASGGYMRQQLALADALFASLQHRAFSGGL